MGKKKYHYNVDPADPKTTQPGNGAKLDAARALILHEEKGLSYEEIGKIYGVDKRTVGRAIRPLRELFGLVGNGRASTEWRSIESKVLDTIRTMVSERMLDDEKLDAASLRDLAFVYREIFQAHRLIEGKSTENVSLRSAMVLDAHERPIYESDESKITEENGPSLPE